MALKTGKDIGRFIRFRLEVIPWGLFVGISNADSRVHQFEHCLAQRDESRIPQTFEFAIVLYSN